MKYFYVILILTLLSCGNDKKPLSKTVTALKSEITITYLDGKIELEVFISKVGEQSKMRSAENLCLQIHGVNKVTFIQKV